MLLEQQVGINQQIVKIHSITLLAALPITQIDIAHQRNLGSLVSKEKLTVGSIRLRQHQLILGITDTTLYHPRFVYLVVQIHLLDDSLQQILRIRSIVNGKIGSKSQNLGLRTQNACKDGMESPHPQVTGTLHTHLAGDTFLHLPGSFIRKGQCQNGPRLEAVVQQIGYLVSQHTGLSRTGPGYHQRRTFVIQYRSTLTLIQFIQISCHHVS